MMNKKKSKFTSWIPLILMLLFFYGPILIMIIYSFNDSKSVTVWSGFSMRWYDKLFTSRDIMDSVKTSVVIALIATAVSTVVGTITAIGISKHKKLVKKTVLTINNFPVLNPEIVTAISLMLLFSSVKIFKMGFATMLIAHITFCIPYVILTVLPKLRKLDPSLADAAMDLGATPSQALWKVIIPQLMPAIISGALIAFTMSFDDFVISYFVTGDGVSNISIMVYTMSKRFDPTINALSTIIIVIITVLLLIINIVPSLKRGTRKVKVS